MSSVNRDPATAAGATLSQVAEALTRLQKLSEDCEVLTERLRATFQSVLVDTKPDEAVGIANAPEKACSALARALHGVGDRLEVSLGSIRNTIDAADVYSDV